ncbi:hypothetical protein AB7W30_21095 [Providencia manganoxydans]|uniref:hypothetical protein n=1 Tax=Providencia TaxID=586 RepID=UPI001123CDCE|nr:hypothetical protein [Providencia stuartii]
MSIFKIESKKHTSTLNNNIYTTSEVYGAKIIKSIGMVKVAISDICLKYNNEDEVAKNELLKITLDNGGNAIINFRYETGSYQRDYTGTYTSYILAFGDAVFIEYND